MSPFVGELIGTMLLILMGNGVVANVVLKKTYGHQAGLIVIGFGWAIAVFAAVIVSSVASGAHLNPAVTIANVFLGKMSSSTAIMYIIAQLLGAMLGALLTYLTYKDHFDSTDDADAIRSSFCTSPAINNSASNLLTETIATFAFVFTILHFAAPDHKLGALDALPVALVVLGIGISLGGPTGYAINPARDLGPRIMHFLLPIKNKKDSKWGYSWIPVLGPILGALIAALVFKTVG